MIDRRLVACTLSSWCAALLVLGGCQLLPFFDDDPTSPCNPEVDRIEARPCGVCNQGQRTWQCTTEGLWRAAEECHDNLLDQDGDGYANGACQGECCGLERDCDDLDSLANPGLVELPGNARDEDCSGRADDVDGDGHEPIAVGGDDCNDSDGRRWLGHADLDGDGHESAECCRADGECGSDCNDDDPERWIGNADLDGDGFQHAECCDSDPCDCDDTDPQRWAGHADLDGDGHDAVSCGGDDCDDTHDQRWNNHADVDGDGHGAIGCCDGCDDCDDNDPLRYSGNADLDGDGFDSARCCDETGRCGQDCDDDCPLCAPDGVGRCGEGRDYDCDGLVDELTSCAVDPPDNPCVLDLVEETGDSRDVFIVDDVAYVASADGLHEVYLDWPGTGVAYQHVDTGDSWGVFATWDTVYVASARGLYLVEFSRSLRAIVTAGPIETGDSRDVFVSGDIAYVASSVGLVIVDVREPTAPRILSRFTRSLYTDARSVFVDDGLAYVASWSSVGGHGIYVLDVSDPTDPEIVLEPYYQVQLPNGIFVARDLVFTAGLTGLIITDVFSHDRPSLLGYVIFEGGNGVFVSSGYTFLSAENGLYIFDVFDPSLPAHRGFLTELGRSRAAFPVVDLVYVATERGLAIVALDCERWTW